ncbi:MAG: hypothetical protein K0U78_00165 [Actinomycetia bacterium]|nr:hypothetical protein [Actinomycetes bacterium]
MITTPIAERVDSSASGRRTPTPLQSPSGIRCRVQPRSIPGATGIRGVLLECYEHPAEHRIPTISPSWFTSWLD